MPTVWRVDLRVIPAVWGEHDAEWAADSLIRFGNQHRTYVGLHSMISDLDTIGERIQREFGSGIPDVLSHRAEQWRVVLGQLSPDPLENRRARNVERSSGTGDLAARLSAGFPHASHR